MTVRFYLDEDVQVFLAEVLRARGVDALHAYEAGRGGDGDDVQFAFAAAEGRCIVMYNRGASSCSPAGSRRPGRPTLVSSSPSVGRQATC